MKCPICGKDLELKNKQTGTNENGDPVFNEYAICRSCRKQWNLDKQRAKKTAAKKAEETVKSTASEKESAAEKISSAKKTDVVKKSDRAKQDENIRKFRSVNTENGERKEEARPRRRPQESVPSSSVPAKKPVRKRSAQEKETVSEEKRYSNIPSEKVRTKHERAARQSYGDMLATGTLEQTDRWKKAQMKDDTKALSSAKRADSTADKYDDYEDDYYEETPRFRAMRIVLGVISLIGFGYFIYRGFSAGLSGSSESGMTSGMVFVILALCMLVSALLYFIMQKTNTVFAFLLPMIFYLGSGVFAFLKRADDLQLLIAAVAGGVLAVISLILAITSRGGDDYDDDDYEAFDDDYADD